MNFGEIFTSIRVRKQKLWTPKGKKNTENIEFWSQKHTFLPPVAEPDHLESSNFLSRCSEECRCENMHRLSKSVHYIAVRIILQKSNDPKNSKYRATDANPRYDTGFTRSPSPLVTLQFCSNTLCFSGAIHSLFDVETSSFFPRYQWFSSFTCMKTNLEYDYNCDLHGGGR